MLGEIIETTSLDFVAESLTLHQPPPLGELVRVNMGDGAVCYGVVCFGTTTSPDSGRRAMRRSDGQAMDEAIYQQHPQLARLLQTIFRAWLVGWRRAGRTRVTLPPSPPPLHYAVHACDPDESHALTERLGYLALLAASRSETPASQLLAAHLRCVYRARGNDEEWLDRAARECAHLFKRDHATLLTLLAAIEPE